MTDVVRLDLGSASALGGPARAALGAQHVGDADRTPLPAIAPVASVPSTTTSAFGRRRRLTTRRGR